MLPLAPAAGASGWREHSSQGRPFRYRCLRGACAAHRQLPGSAYTSGKNKSFQLAGLILIEPTACMNSAYFSVLSGTIVHFTSLPEAISATLSAVSFDLTSSSQYCAAGLTSLLSISVASRKAPTSAL